MIISNECGARLSIAAYLSAAPIIIGVGAVRS